MADSSLKSIQGAALTADQKRDLMHRLARVEGQLRGVQKLIANAEAPQDCDAVAQQMAAARKALDRAFVTMLTSTMITQITPCRQFTKCFGTGPAPGGHAEQVRIKPRSSFLPSCFDSP